MQVDLNVNEQREFLKACADTGVLDPETVATHLVAQLISATPEALAWLGTHIRRQQPAQKSIWLSVADAAARAERAKLSDEIELAALVRKIARAEITPDVDARRNPRFAHCVPSSAA